jgi:hypothetical protein
MIGFTGTSFTVSLNYSQYSAIVNLHFTVAHTLGFSVSISCLLATDLSTETSTSNHYKVFFPFIVQSSWNLGTQLKTLQCTALCTNLSYNRPSLYRICTDNTENTSHVIPIQWVHWCADCCLATSCNICPLRHMLHCCTLERVYQAIA